MQFGAVLALITTAVAPFAALAGEPRGWSFVQSVGGIAIESPVRGPKGWWLLPVRANLSGLETVSVTPTVLNSALACERTAVVSEGPNIYLTIESGLPGKNRSSRCPPADLHGIAPGRYRVFYRGPGEVARSLGEVRLEL